MDQLIFIGVVWYVVFVLSTTLHEAAHAWAAMRLGDPTGYAGGSATIDPTPHIVREPIGMAVLPILSLFFYQAQWILGWASCPYDPRWAIRHPKRAAWMAAAGPAANLLLAFAAALGIRAGLAAGFFRLPERGYSFAHIVDGGDYGLSNGLAVLASIVFSLNGICFLFNLLPLPPLDGSAVVMLFLDDESAERFQSFAWDPTVMAVGSMIALVAGPYLGVHPMDFAVRLMLTGY